MTPVTRPHSRWRGARHVLLIFVGLLWALGVAVLVTQFEWSAGWLVVAAAGATLTYATWLFVHSEKPRFWLLTLGVATTMAGISNMIALIGTVIALIVIVGSVGGRRGVWPLVVVTAAQWGRQLLEGFADRSRGVVPQLIDAVLVGGLLLLGWYIGALVFRAESTADQLWRAHRQLEASAATQRELVLAEERTRAAQELHDGLGHQLTLIQMSLEFAERMRDRDPDRAWAEVREAGRTGARALSDMRAWVRAMSPPSAADGVGPMLESLAASFRSTGLDVQVGYVGPDGSLPEDVELFVRRVVQESLTNVLKHSNATHVRIDVARQDRLQIVVADDGTAGVDPVAEGFGLRSLRERAAALGGECTCAHTPTGGFRLTASVPVARPPEGAFDPYSDALSSPSKAVGA